MIIDTGLEARNELLRDIRKGIFTGAGLPKSAFGEVAVAELTPVVQLTSQYGQLGRTESFVIGAGSTGSEDGKFYAVTNSSQGDISALTSVRSVSYRAGQGGEGKFTGKFDTPKQGNFQFVGLVSATDFLGFGYSDLTFGIHYQRGGVVECQTLTLTSGAGGSETATVTIDDEVFSVPLTLGTAAENCYEIAESLNGQTDKYSFDSIQNTVVATSVLSQPAGVFAFSSATAAGAWVQNAAGQITDQGFIPQSGWSESIDFEITPDKLTPFKIAFQYLGGGNIFFYAENPDTGAFELVHMEKLAGTLDSPNLTNPSFRLGVISNNILNDTPVRVESGSMAGFIQGKREFTESSLADSETKTDIGATLTNIITFKARTEFGFKRSLIEAQAVGFSGSTDSAKPIEVEIIKNATFANRIIYDYIDQDESMTLTSKTETEVTGGEIALIEPAGSYDVKNRNLVFAPGETMTIAMRVTQTPASAMTASAVWFEDI